MKTKEQQTISLAMSILGRRGGKKTSDAKKKAAAKSLKKARAVRWAKAKNTNAPTISD